MRIHSDKKLFPRMSLLLPMILLFLSSGSLVFAQNSHKPENLQVLPKDIEHDQLIDIMRGFTRALDVNCSFCHAQDPDNPNDLDFPADKKETKKTARVMMHMVETINNRLLPRTGRKNLLKVQCITCHHGLQKPHTLQHELQTVYNKGGLDSAVVRYKKTRDQYYGLGAFDFGESALILTARDFADAGHLDAAERFLNMNLDYFPKSANTYAQLAILYNKKGAKNQSMEYFQKALQIEPNNQRIRYMMNQIQQQK